MVESIQEEGGTGCEKPGHHERGLRIQDLHNVIGGLEEELLPFKCCHIPMVDGIGMTEHPWITVLQNSNIKLQ